MKKLVVSIGFFVFIMCIMLSFKTSTISSYKSLYLTNTSQLESDLANLIFRIQKQHLSEPELISAELDTIRLQLKQADFWLRYLEPTAYKKINGPLPVEWETEVFEKYEKPYKREGAGLTLAPLYLDEPNYKLDSLIRLLELARTACKIYKSDSLTAHLDTHDQFYLCNRLFLLNLAAIYTTGFECPKSERVIPELKHMLQYSSKIYTTFNQSFPEYKLSSSYLQLYQAMLDFVNKQSNDNTTFNHFEFIKSYVNPLFAMNQQFINDYKVRSRSNMDYALNKTSVSIFDKNLYDAQNTKGIFLRVNDTQALQEIEEVGRLLFYDPILSGNNERSCASCHQSTQFFSDTVNTTALAYNGKSRLPRNTPSLVNAQFNHLLLNDGKHLSLQEQTKAVITNTLEMNGDEKEVLKKILSCKEYKIAFKKFLEYTPQEKEISMEHICSAITIYYGKFSKQYSLFDEAIHNKSLLSKEETEGFNLFMSKAQCATCHFAPQFNGVKPPYIGSEFEVLGTPADTSYSALSKDEGRYLINPAIETHRAFRTGSIRNSSKTKPYMHNGVFNTLSQVVDFYNYGGGAGRGLKLENQTLSSDSLHLTEIEKQALIKFMNTLTENIKFDSAPTYLPKSSHSHLNNRKAGGVY
jgi:cytochrome c peroxidase